MDENFDLKAEIHSLGFSVSQVPHDQFVKNYLAALREQGIGITVVHLRTGLELDVS